MTDLGKLGLTTALTLCLLATPGWAQEPEPPPTEATPPAEATPPTEPPPAQPPAAETPAEAPDASDAAPPTESPAVETPSGGAPAAAAEPPAAEAPTPDASDAAAPAEAPQVVLEPPAVESEPVETVEDAPAEGEPIEEIVVTGSRIKRTNFASSAPVAVISREQLEYSGATNLADVVQYLTVGQGSGFRGDFAGAGTIGVNLRGLGGSATLVLINGRRVATSGGGITSQFVDIGTIPMSIVERIEILKGGASSIYGTDAIAGVVNVITRQDWDGLRAEVDYQATEEFDHDWYTASVAMGAASERSRVNAALEYQRISELRADERPDFTRGPSGNQDYSSFGQPGSYIVGISPMADPTCDSVQGSMVMPSSAGTGTICQFDIQPFQSLVGANERMTAFASAEFDVTQHTSLFAELNVARTRGHAVTSPSFPLLTVPTIPADHIDNPYGQDVTFLGRIRGAEHGPKRNMMADDTLRLAVGIHGDFEDAAANTLAEDWEWELYGTWGQSRYRGLINDSLSAELQEALNSCSDPTDLSGCYNPFGSGTPNSEAVLDRIEGGFVTQTDQAMHTANAGLTGSLFELPGGDFAFAFGGQYRLESRASENDNDAAQENYAVLLGNSDAIAERNVYAAYLECLWPLLDGLEVQTAGRIETYDDTDDLSANPTIGLTLVPASLAGRDSVPEALRKLTLRGHFATAFRAPSLYQSFPGTVVTPTSIAAPGSPLPETVPNEVSGNPDVGPETAFILSAGLTWLPIDEIAISGDFWHYDYKDRITTESATVQRAMDEAMRDPTKVQRDAAGNITRIFTTNINLDGVVTYGLDFDLAVILSGESFGGSADDWGRLTLSTSGTYTMAYYVPLEATAPDARDTGEIDCDDERCEVSGLRNNSTFAPPPLPKWRVNFPITWGFKGHGLSLIPRYISGMKDDDTVNITDDGEFPDIDGFFVMDAQYSYRLDDEIGKATTFRIGVYNMLDQDPPGVETMNGFIGTHDPRGRMFYAKLIQEF
ncbi:MAG: TonB-dependent receptor [Myxococcales bacterium]|nr:TonB-dependent receptor [Myxococcales bacterium]